MIKKLLTVIAVAASVAALTAGTASAAPTVTDSASDNGGHCQFGLSYNGTGNWIVLTTIVRRCSLVETGPVEITVPLPLGVDGAVPQRF